MLDNKPRHVCTRGGDNDREAIVCNNIGFQLICRLSAHYLFSVNNSLLPSITSVFLLTPVSHTLLSPTLPSSPFLFTLSLPPLPLLFPSPSVPPFIPLDCSSSLPLLSLPSSISSHPPSLFFHLTPSLLSLFCSFLPHPLLSPLLSFPHSVLPSFPSSSPLSPIPPFSLPLIHSSPPLFPPPLPHLS